MEIGGQVDYVDQFGKPHPALVTAVHGSGDEPSLNVVYVSDTDAETDQYGRQIRRETSVVHSSKQGAHGRFWRNDQLHAG